MQEPQETPLIPIDELEHRVKQYIIGQDTQEGYYGADVEDMIYKLVENADGDLAKASRGMIVIDEIVDDNTQYVLS